MVWPFEKGIFFESSGRWMDRVKRPVRMTTAEHMIEMFRDVLFKMHPQLFGTLNYLFKEEEDC